MASGPADAENLSHDAQTVKRGGWHLPDQAHFPAARSSYITGRVVHFSQAALADETLTMPMLAVYIALASFASYETGKAWPAISTLANLSRCSRRTVQRSLASLEAAGYLRRTYRKNLRQSTIYELLR